MPSIKILQDLNVTGVLTANTISVQNLLTDTGSLAVTAIRNNLDSNNTLLSSNSGNWDDAYNAVQSGSAAWALSGISLSDVTDYLSSNSVTISSVNVTNGFKVGSGSTVLYVSGSKVGINTETPNKELTVIGNISATGYIYGDGSNLTGISQNNTEVSNVVISNSATWIDVSTVVQNNSTAWAIDTAILTLSNSANWDASYTALTSTSAAWDDTNSVVQSNSAYWSSFSSQSANLDSVYNTVSTNSGSWCEAYTSVNSNSSNWDSVYNTVNSNSGNWESVYSIVESLSVDGNFQTLNVTTTASILSTLAIGTSVPNTSKKLHVVGDVLVYGNLSANGTMSFANTLFTTTSALSISNTGTGPALIVAQEGDSAVAAFYDHEGGIGMWIDGDASRPAYVGIKTTTPNKELTVVGDISATGSTYSNYFYGNGSNLTGITQDDVPVSTLVRNHSGSWENSYTYLNSTSGSFVLSGDSRLTNSRTPTEHKSTHAINGSDALSPSDIGAVSVSSLSSVSGNWNSTYTTVSSNSGTWKNAVTNSGGVSAIRSLTQATFNSIIPDANTLYIITA